MCKAVKNGYEFQDGTTLSNQQIVDGDISLDKITELYKTPSTAMDSVRTNQSIQEMRGEIGKTHYAVKELGSLIKKHGSACPLNVGAINQMIDTRIEENTEKYRNGGKESIALNNRIVSTVKTAVYEMITDTANLTKAVAVIFGAFLGGSLLLKGLSYLFTWATGIEI